MRTIKHLFSFTLKKISNCQQAGKSLMYFDPLILKLLEYSELQNKNKKVCLKTICVHSCCVFLFLFFFFFAVPAKQFDI